MRKTCLHVKDMSKMIQIRNVPDELHRKLKARSAMAGMSLSEYLLNEVSQIAERPSMEEWLARVERRSPVSPSVSPAQIVREARDSR
jgi:plasmid stability protein